MKGLIPGVVLLCGLPLLAAEPAAPMVKLTLALRATDDTPKQLQQVHVSAGETKITLTTDRKGYCHTTLPPGDVTFTIGPATYVVVLASGAPNTYTLVDGWRQVTQTVRTQEGLPAARSIVHASYAWHGQCGLMHAVADARGQVHWPSVPPAPVVVWGEGVPAGVLASDLTMVTAPLPPPREETSVLLNFYFPDVTQRIDVSRAVCGVGPLSGHFDPDEFRVLKRGMVEQLRAGQPFTYMVVTKTSPPQLAYVDPMYAPIPEKTDQQQSLLFPLYLKDTSILHLRFTTPDHQPLAAPSRLVVLPAQPHGLPELLHGPAAARFGFFSPKIEPDGSVTVLLPRPGNIRLMIDCYDLTTKTPPELLVDVPAGDTAATVPLPPALLEIPPGAELYWVTRNAPSAARHFTAVAGGKSMPVFGPRDDVLACWFMQDADHLVVWKGDDPANSPIMLNRRQVAVTPIDEGGNPLRRRTRLAALLPRMPDTWGSSTIPGKGSDAIDTPVSPAKPSDSILWTAPYALTDGGSLMQVLPIPHGDEPKITLSPTITFGKPVAAPRIRWHFPDLDYQALGLRSAQLIKISYDTPIEGGGLFKSYAGMRVEPGAEDQLLPNPLLTMSAVARTVTFEWLGVGIIRDIPIPHTGNAVTDVTLPEWNSGVTVSGIIYHADGTPAANASLGACTALLPMPGGESILNFRTDANGQFTLRGISPGQLLISGFGSGWTLTVPDKGMKGAELRATLHPMEWRFPQMNGPLQAWWIPDTGTPGRVVTYDNRITTYDRPASSGIFWVFTASHSSLVRYVPCDNDLYNMDAAPSLGLYVPLDARIGMPDGVELTGIGARAGLRVIARLFWQPSPLLGAILGQIDAVPPGDYQVKVATSQGALNGTVTVSDTGGAIHFVAPARAGGAR